MPQLTYKHRLAYHAPADMTFISINSNCSDLKCENLVNISRDLYKYILWYTLTEMTENCDESMGTLYADYPECHDSFYDYIDFKDLNA